MKAKHLLATALPALLLGSAAHAVRPPKDFNERSLETAQGVARTARAVGLTTPSVAASEWSRFLSARGTWFASWDADTGVPSQIYGEGIDAPGSVADAAAAESAARALLGENVQLLARGSSVDDFTVSANIERGGVRIVRFAQHYRGMKVVGGEVSFTFEHDRMVMMGSTAAPDVTASVPSSFVPRADAGAKATAWVSAIYRSIPTVLDTGAAEILPIVRSGGKSGIEYHTVVPVIVDQKAPRAQWTVWVDAATGAPVARHQRLAFASGTLDFHVPIRYPMAGFHDAPAPYLNVTADGAAATTSLVGLLNWTSQVTSTVVPSTTGTYITVSDNGGNPAASGSVQIGPNASGSWDQSSSEFSDAQLAAYINANAAKQFALTHYDANLAWLQANEPVFVNESGSCNAYSQGDDIHFFPSDSQCHNTGEISDVLFHEFGHSLNFQFRGGSFPSDDGSLSEGLADFNAANMMEDPNLGLGFFIGMETQFLRTADPVGKEFKWPDDHGEAHATGQIISGALWDLRKAAIATMGADAGRTWIDKIFVGILTRSNDIPGTYNDALISDDDDGNLANGTPNKCMIDAAFGPHGLGSGTTTPIGVASPPTVDGLNLTLAPLPAGSGACAAPTIASATVTWRLRSDPATTGTVDFTIGANGGGTAAIPKPATNGEVVEYQVAVTTSYGNTQTFPENPADPWYQLYSGGKTEIYCTDFESTDPTTDGWTLGTGWGWGALTPAGMTTDPTTAASGSKEIGINLSGDYASNSTYDATSKTVDVSAFAGSQIHLQFKRWLGAEDSMYDHAIINVNGTPAWNNPSDNQGGTLEFVDKEWRFVDLDVTQAAASGAVQIGYHLDSDGGVEYAGWNVDDFCLIAVTTPPPVCGDGNVDPGEQCDDGNTVSGDGCSSTCQDETGGGKSGGCCSTGDETGVGGPLLLGFVVGGFVVIRRRRT